MFFQANINGQYLPIPQPNKRLHTQIKFNEQLHIPPKVDDYI